MSDVEVIFENICVISKYDVMVLVREAVVMRCYLIFPKWSNQCCQFHLQQLQFNNWQLLLKSMHVMVGCMVNGVALICIVGLILIDLQWQCNAATS